MTTTPTRDAAFVSGKYEQMWGGVRDFVRSLRGAGNDDLADVFHRTLQYTNGISPGGEFVPSASWERTFIFHGVEVRMAAMAQEYVWRDMVAGEVMRAMSSETNLIVELGSGWSANIFNLWLRGAPGNATYLGCELTEGGREAATSLAGTRPAMKYAACAFDWNSPDFSFVPREASHVTLFSCHSIEQIPELHPQTIRDLLLSTSGAKSVQGVFIEPVGWQFPEYSPNPALGKLAGEYCRRQNYNRNLRKILEDLAGENRIRLLVAAVDAFGTTINPSTVIHWQRI